MAVETPRLFVVGASAGGVEALTALLSRLPADLPAPIAIVLHRSPFSESMLAAVLGRRTTLKVMEPADGEVLRQGVAYVAPRNRHLLIERARVRVEGGPKEHYTRPAIDPLFRSAAAAFGASAVGVLLSGTGSDGVSGLMAIGAAGGIKIAQDPTEARHPEMPWAAITHDDVDAVLRVAEIAAAIVHLASGGDVRAATAGTGRA